MSFLFCYVTLHCCVSLVTSGAMDHSSEPLGRSKMCFNYSEGAWPSLSVWISR